jgi:hypothetical protein
MLYSVKPIQGSIICHIIRLRLFCWPISSSKSSISIYILITILFCRFYLRCHLSFSRVRLISRHYSYMLWLRIYLYFWRLVHYCVSLGWMNLLFLLYYLLICLVVKTLMQLAVHSLRVQTFSNTILFLLCLISRPSHWLRRRSILLLVNLGWLVLGILK